MRNSSPNLSRCYLNRRRGTHLVKRLFFDILLENIYSCKIFRKHQSYFQWWSWKKYPISRTWIRVVASHLTAFFDMFTSYKSKLKDIKQQTNAWNAHEPLSRAPDENPLRTEIIFRQSSRLVKTRDKNICSTSHFFTTCPEMNIVKSVLWHALTRAVFTLYQLKILMLLKSSSLRLLEHFRSEELLPIHFGVHASNWLLNWIQLVFKIRWRVFQKIYRFRRHFYRCNHKCFDVAVWIVCIEAEIQRQSHLSSAMGYFAREYQSWW